MSTAPACPSEAPVMKTDYSSVWDLNNYVSFAKHFLRFAFMPLIPLTKKSLFKKTQTCKFSVILVNFAVCAFLPILTSQFLALRTHVSVLLLPNDPSEISLAKWEAQRWGSLLKDTGESPSLQIFKTGVDKAMADLIWCW